LDIGRGISTIPPSALPDVQSATRAFFQAAPNPPESGMRRARYRSRRMVRRLKQIENRGVSVMNLFLLMALGLAQLSAPQCLAGDGVTFDQAVDYIVTNINQNAGYNEVTFDRGEYNTCSQTGKASASYSSLTITVNTSSTITCYNNSTGRPGNPTTTGFSWPINLRNCGPMTLELVPPNQGARSVPMLQVWYTPIFFENYETARRVKNAFEFACSHAPPPPKDPFEKVPTGLNVDEDGSANKAVAELERERFETKPAQSTRARAL
jgi:hypothetical protein